MDDRKDEKPQTGRNQDLREVSRVWGPMEAELTKTFLESNGISCLIRGRTVPFVYPFTVDGLAEFKIFVEARDFEAARALLASRPEPSDDPASEDQD